MSERFPPAAERNTNNAKLTNSVGLGGLGAFSGEDAAAARAAAGLDTSYDHMYATNHDDDDENGLTDVPQTTCQTAESEVNFLKQFLLIHLDLIQQQSDDILNKENTIFVLQQENARLRERLRCMESGSPYQSSSGYARKKSNSSPDSFGEDMTLDQGSLEVDNSENLVQIAHADCPQLGRIVETEDEEEEEEEDEEEEDEEGLPRLKAEIDDDVDVRLSNDIADIGPILPDGIGTNELILKEEPLDCGGGGVTPPDDVRTTAAGDAKPDESVNVESVRFSQASYTIHASPLVAGSDPMKNLKMSIRRKRLCSNSSAVSNNDSTSDEKRNFRRSRKKRRRVVKNDQIQTHGEQYVTQVGNQLLDAIRRQELADEVARAASATNLEVPRWRVKVYTSCYTMEGTENLEDEVFLRRHNRLENDERRRKRWDVQRIREQRIIEKLKQRQEKIDSSHRGAEQSELLESLWPSIDDIKYIEMTDVLPVSAFGCPIPKLEPSEFSLPWLLNPNMKKTATRRSTSRRRGKR